MRPYILMLKILKWLVGSVRFNREKKTESEKSTREYSELVVCVRVCVSVRFPFLTTLVCSQCQMDVCVCVGFFTCLPSFTPFLSLTRCFFFWFFLISSIYMWCVSRSSLYIVLNVLFLCLMLFFLPYFPKFERNHHFIFPFDDDGSSNNQHNANTEMN